jgi:hypothetical protein
MSTVLHFGKVLAGGGSSHTGNSYHRPSEARAPDSYRGATAHSQGIAGAPHSGLTDFTHFTGLTYFTDFSCFLFHIQYKPNLKHILNTNRRIMLQQLTQL